MCELGWQSLGVLELTALPSIDKERWVPWVREADVLLVNGGDALYLCHWMRQSGLADLLPSLRETVWVGAERREHGADPQHRADFVEWTPAHRRRRDAGPGGLRDLPAPGSPESAGQHHGQRGEMGGRYRRCRPTRSTTRPPSRSLTAPSKSSPRGTGSCSPPMTERRSGFARDRWPWWLKLGGSEA